MNTVRKKLEAKPRPPEPDYVDRVAMRSPLGIVYSMARPARHGDLIHSIVDNGIAPPGLGDWAQGFLTRSGVYLDRVQAYQHANDNDQIVPIKRVIDGLERTHLPAGPELYSEDLW